MKIDLLIQVLQTYKLRGATQVLISTDDTKPPEGLSVYFAPVGDNTTVYVHPKNGDDLRSVNKAPIIVESDVLSTTEWGRHCEQCTYALNAHQWVALDHNGFVIQCSVMQHKYALDLIRAGNIKRRAMSVSGEELKAYE